MTIYSASLAPPTEPLTEQQIIDEFAYVLRGKWDVEARKKIEALGKVLEEREPNSHWKR